LVWSTSQIKPWGVREPPAAFGGITGDGASPVAPHHCRAPRAAGHRRLQPELIAVQFARPSVIFGEGGTDPVTTAEAAVERLSGNPALNVVETSDSRIGGLDGSQITVENSGVAHATVMHVPPGPLGIDPGRRLWIAFFDTSEGLLAIMVGGSVAHWDEALAAAEPVLESVQIGP
jgi:hypothetical protein